jgi:hypothetical protein
MTEEDEHDFENFTAGVINGRANLGKSVEELWLEYNQEDDSINAIIEDIALACLTPLPEIVTARRSAMHKLASRLLHPLDIDLARAGIKEN